MGGRSTRCDWEMIFLNSLSKNRNVVSGGFGPQLHTSATVGRQPVGDSKFSIEGRGPSESGLGVVWTTVGDVVLLSSNF